MSHNPSPNDIREIAHGVVGIDATFDDAPNIVYLVSGERRALVDTGIATTPHQQLFPALARLGLAPTDIDVVVNTHGHHDHRGGNAALKDANPRVEILCHDGDRGWIEDVDRYLSELYWSLGPEWTPPDGFDDRIRRLSGDDVAVDRTLSDGDRIDLGDGVELEVHHVPAHSPGHLVIHHAGAGVLFTGDALQADGTPLQVRKPFFPLYDSVDAYQGSLELFDRIGADLVATSHCGVQDRDGTRDLIDVSRTMVADAHRVVVRVLAERRRTTLGEVVESLSSTWPHYDVGAQLVRTARAHLDQLDRSGEARHVADEGVWELVELGPSSEAILSGTEGQR